MKAQRGKKAKYVKYTEKGLLKDGVWKKILQSYPTTLIKTIRQRLIAEIPNLNEKFNTKSRYFGYYTKDNEDRLYIYVQKEKLVVDLCIQSNLKDTLVTHGFQFRPRDNFQAKHDWLTGWHVQQSTTDVKTVMKWVCRAFDRNI
jgi:hypothetical protein